ncbi:MAG: ECF transporter S component [Clostridia bacterium]|nr:ECF transporter S component [Clostridia bacterium]
MRRNVKTDILQMVELAMLLALVIVLQMIGGMIKIGPFSPSLVLIPIVIGSIIIGAKGGAILGAAFGIVVIVQCALGMDAGGFILWGINPFLTALICLTKGICAGLVPGLIYRALTGKEPSDKRIFLAAVVSSLSAPIVNTGLFLIGLSVFFTDTLYAWSGGTNVIIYIITGLVGLNFLVEFGINAIVSPAVSTVVKVVTKYIYKK